MVVHLIAILHYYSGKLHSLPQVIFVLSSTPIPILVGLETAQNLVLNVKSGKESGSHLEVSKWKASFPLSVLSLLRIEFEPVHTETDPHFDWLQHNVALQKPVLSQFTDHVQNSSYENLIGHILLPRDVLKNLNTKDVVKLHERLPHPTSNYLINTLQDQAFGTKLRPQVKSKVISTSNNYQQCAKHAELSSTLKLAMPPSPTSIIAETMDIIHYYDKKLQMKVLVMLDAADKILWLPQFYDDSVKSAFQACLWKWMSYLDVPIFTIAARGLNVFSSYMPNKLLEFSSQISSIPTNASWSIGSNERYHRSLRKLINT